MHACVRHVQEPQPQVLESEPWAVLSPHPGGSFPKSRSPVVLQVYGPGP